MFKFNPNASYMMPAHFGPRPMHPKSSGWYRDVTVMAISYLTDREKLAAMLPEPFEVGDDALITVAYACNKQVDWLAGHGYNLIGVHASVVYQGEKERIPGTYTLVMWENLADPILTGRELQGIPKLFATIPEHSIDDGVWRTHAGHFGHEIVNLSISDLRSPSAEEIAAYQVAQKGHDNPMGWRLLPAIGGFGITTSEPTIFPSEAHYTDAQVGRGALKWNELTWEQNPTQFHIVNALAGLPVLEIRPALVTKGSVNLLVPSRWPKALELPEILRLKMQTNETIREINLVCFVGAGTMGCFNSLVAALAGYNAILYDASETSLAAAPAKQRNIAGFLVQSGFCTPQALGSAFGRIRVCSDLREAIADADLISESVFERLELKRELHQELDRLCKPSAILTTNTSALRVSDIESVVERGGKFAALHSHLGAPLIDIVGGPRTSAETIETLRRYVLSIKGYPLILKRESPGYVLNAMLGSVLSTALALVVDGVSSPQSVDRAWMQSRSAPMGPFGMLDLFGLDVVRDSYQHDSGIPDPRNLRPKLATYLTSLVDKGAIGMKVGKGFYHYPDPEYGKQKFLEEGGKELDPLKALFTATLIFSGVRLALDDVAEPALIDEAWCVGTRLAHGPFEILKVIGTQQSTALLENHRELFDAATFPAVVAYLQKLPPR